VTCCSAFTSLSCEECQTWSRVFGPPRTMSTVCLDQLWCAMRMPAGKEITEIACNKEYSHAEPLFPNCSMRKSPCKKQHAQCALPTAGTTTEYSHGMHACQHGAPHLHRAPGRGSCPCHKSGRRNSFQRNMHTSPSKPAHTGGEKTPNACAARPRTVAAHMLQPGLQHCVAAERAGAALWLL